MCWFILYLCWQRYERDEKLTQQTQGHDAIATEKPRYEMFVTDGKKKTKNICLGQKWLKLIQFNNICCEGDSR